MAQFDALAALQVEAALPANSFSIGRFGEPTEGININLNRGEDPFRSLPPRIQIGDRRWIARSRENGALYRRSDTDKDVGVARRIWPELNEPVDRPDFWTLTCPVIGPLMYSVLRIDLRDRVSKVAVEGRELHIHFGLCGGTTIARAGAEALVYLKNGEELTLFFPDGHVRSFRQEGTGLRELVLNRMEMLDLRIEDAFRRCHEVDHDLSDEEYEKKIRYILSGMADLLSLTRLPLFKGTGQDVRWRVIEEFFLKLPEGMIDLVHRKLTAILHRVDPALITMISRKGPVSFVTEIQTVTDIEAARERKRRESRRDARSVADQALRNSMRGASGGGGGKKNSRKK